MKISCIEALEPRRLCAAGPYVSSSAGTMLFNQEVGDTSHAQYLTLTNTGGKPLAITSVGVTGAYARRFNVSTRGLPKTLAPGASAAVKVSFSPLDVAIATATLQITTNARGGGGVVSTALRGLGTAGLYDQFEPSLQRILDAEQVPVNVGDANVKTALLDGPGRSDEVPVQLLQRAGSGPVRLSLLAVFSYDTSPTVTVGWYTPGSSTPTLVPQLVSPAGNAQAVNPSVTGSGKFYPAGSFGLYATWPGQPHGPSYSQAALNSSWDLTGDAGQKMRFYPYKLPNGRVVPHAYVVAMEESSDAAHRDFNDAIAIISNVEPVAASSTPAAVVPALAPDVFSVTAKPLDRVWDDAAGG